MFVRAFKIFVHTISNDQSQVLCLQYNDYFLIYDREKYSNKYSKKYILLGQTILRSFN